MLNLGSKLEEEDDSSHTFTSTKYFSSKGKTKSFYSKIIWLLQEKSSFASKYKVVFNENMGICLIIKLINDLDQVGV